MEAAPLDRISADLLQVRIHRRSRLAGVEMGELRLPVDTVVSLIIRDGHPFYPERYERIKVGDELLVVTPRPSGNGPRPGCGSSAGGRLARWRTPLARIGSRPAGELRRSVAVFVDERDEVRP